MDESWLLHHEMRFSPIFQAVGKEPNFLLPTSTICFLWGEWVRGGPPQVLFLIKEYICSKLRLRVCIIFLQRLQEWMSLSHSSRRLLATAVSAGARIRPPQHQPEGRWAMRGNARDGNRGADRGQRGPLRGGQRGRWGRWWKFWEQFWELQW
jgi:hypothetical protein